MKIDSLIEGIGKVVIAIDSQPNIKSWSFDIYAVNEVPSKVTISVESNILCLSDLLKVLVTSISRVELIGRLPNMADYDDDDVYVLGFVPEG